ncbi:MAG: hypothetical protein ACI8RZ_007718, partial [Myxococcota bacterium]
MSARRHCREIHLALTVFRSGSSTDLPDDIALHIEDCPICMERFEVLFPPLRFDATPAAPLRQRAQGRSAVAVAAIGLLALGMSPPQPDADPFALLLHEESALT